MRSGCDHTNHYLCRCSTILIVILFVSYITFYMIYLTLKSTNGTLVRPLGDTILKENRPKTESYHSAKKVRILCWVMTNPTNHREKAIPVQRIWSQRCDKILFMSTEEDSELNSVAPNVEEGRDHLWAKTKEAFKYVYHHHLDEAEWFLKADDDTYVIVENLRVFLRDFDANNTMYFGCKFKSVYVNGYMSGGAGYVLSKEGFVENSLPDGSKCRQEDNGDEDLEMGICLRNIGIEATDTRDSFGRYRFHPFNPEIEMVPRTQSHPYWNFMYHPIENNLDGVSTIPFSDADENDQLYPMHYMAERVISFHYIPPKQMYLIDYLLYHLRLT